MTGEQFIQAVVQGDPLVQAIAAAVGLLLLILLLALALRLRRRRRLRDERARRARRARETALAEAQVPPPLEDEQAESAEDEPAIGQDIQVSEVDPLAEVSVYLQYGYLDRAAQTLRWYVDEVDGSDRKALKKLLEIYLQTGEIDEFAGVLDRIFAVGANKAAAQKAVLAGLRKDPENLQLRVFADTHLGLDVEALNELLGIGREPAPAPAAKPQEPTEAEVIPFQRREQPAAAKRPERRRSRVALVDGDTALAPLTVEERTVLAVFGEPAETAKLHLAFREVEEAVAALRRGIEQEPKTLSHYNEILRLLHMRREVADYAAVLWRLYTVLGSAGRTLRERLLSAGLALGRHPVLEALAGEPDARALDDIGRRFGLLPSEPQARTPIVLAESGGLGATGSAADDDVLTEVDSYLEYGQIDHAVEVLEQAILGDPLQAQYYPPLLDLYDRMDAYERFTRLAASVKRKVQRPPEEVIPLMQTLYKRLQQRRQQTLAG